MIYSALILGLFGSMHCAGMCGPIALALPLTSKNTFSFFLGRSLYNIGRIITYSLLGAIVGSLGMAISFAGFQKGLSIIIGVILLPAAFSFLPALKKHSFFVTHFISDGLKKLLSPFLHSSKAIDAIIVGMLNGFLPCGLVYTALAAATTTGTAINGILFMAIFGAGTFPMMLALSLSGKIIPGKFRSRITRFFPYLTALLAVLLILRGMNLGIPFVSPEIIEGSASANSCH